MHWLRGLRRGLPLKRHFHGAEGAAPADHGACPAVIGLAEQTNHQLDHGRPHTGLGQTIDAPDGCHLHMGLAQGNQQIHDHGDQQANKHQPLRRNLIADVTAEDLAKAIGNGAAGNCRGEHGFGHAGLLHNGRNRAQPLVQYVRISRRPGVLNNTSHKPVLTHAHTRINIIRFSIDSHAHLDRTFLTFLSTSTMVKNY